MDEFDGKVAVITGGASGIGLAMARRFGAEGMKLVIADIQQDALDRAVVLLNGEGIETVGVRADVSDRAQVETIADVALDTHGAVHLAVNNAGVGVGGLTWELSEADWRWVIDVDLWGVIHGVGVFTPLIIEAGGGHVVNTASMAGLTSTPFMSPYNVAKHGVVTLSETMFHELAMAAPSVGITVVCPGWVQTGINRSERNRPTDGTHAVATGGDADVADASAGVISSMIDNLIADGLSPATVADQIFDAVVANRFYVLTHPEWAGMVRKNTEIMLGGGNPEMVMPANG